MNEVLDLLHAEKNLHASTHIRICIFLTRGAMSPRLSAENVRKIF